MRVKVTPVRKKHADALRFSESNKIKYASFSCSSGPETPAKIKKAKKIYLQPRVKPIEKEKSPSKSATEQRIELEDESGYETDTKIDEEESGFWRDYLFVMALCHTLFNL